MMTQQHFVELAKAFKLNKPTDISVYRTRQWENDCVAVAAVCEFSNPRFNLKKFLLACGFGRSQTERYCQ